MVVVHKRCRFLGMLHDSPQLQEEEGMAANSCLRYLAVARSEKTCRPRSVRTCFQNLGSEVVLQICFVPLPEEEWMNVLKEQICLWEVEHVLSRTCRVTCLQELGCPN